MYGEIIGLHSESLQSLIGQIKKGLPVDSLTKLSDQLGVPEKHLANTVNIAQRTLTRRKNHGGLLKSDESERVLRIARLFERAIEVMGTAELAQRWFKTPVRALMNQTPLQFADTEPGAQEVEAVLDRIEDGVYV